MKVVGALVTHYHQDHVGGSIFGMNIEGVGRLLARQPMPIYVNEHEAEGTKRVTGASESDLARKRGGDAIELGGVRVRLLHTPGHTPGSQCFLVEEPGQPGPARLGRHALPRELRPRRPARAAIPRRCTTASTRRSGGCPTTTLLYPGHLYSAEPFDTLGEQKRTNPFLRVASLDQFLMFMGGLGRSQLRLIPVAFRALFTAPAPPGLGVFVVSPFPLPLAGGLPP